LNNSNLESFRIRNYPTRRREMAESGGRQRKAANSKQRIPSLKAIQLSCIKLPDTRRVNYSKSLFLFTWRSEASSIAAESFVRAEQPNCFGGLSRITIDLAEFTRPRASTSDRAIVCRGFTWLLLLIYHTVYHCAEQTRRSLERPHRRLSAAKSPCPA